MQFWNTCVDGRGLISNYQKLNKKRPRVCRSEPLNFDEPRTILSGNVPNCLGLPGVPAIGIKHAIHPAVHRILLLEQIERGYAAQPL